MLGRHLPRPRDTRARRTPNSIPHTYFNNQATKTFTNTHGGCGPSWRSKVSLDFREGQRRTFLKSNSSERYVSRGTEHACCIVRGPPPRSSLPFSIPHACHSRSSAARRLENETAQEGACIVEGLPFFAKGHCSTMGLPFGKKKAEPGDKKDLKANYTTEDHKTDLGALLASLNTHPTQVGFCFWSCTVAA